MTIDTPNTPDWLKKAEADHAASLAVNEGYAEEFAASLAKEVNTKLTELGITPVTGAGTDGHGRLIPALLVPSDAEQRFYGVHASFDEDDGCVQLLVSDYASGPGCMFEGEHLSVDQLTGVADVLHARRNGPKPPSTPRPQLSHDTKAIVNALDEVRSALETLARCVSRP